MEGRDSRQCIQACRVTGLVSGWLDETTTVIRTMDVAMPRGTGRGDERRLCQSLAGSSDRTYWMQTVRVNVWLFPAWMPSSGARSAEARHERRISRECGQLASGGFGAVRRGRIRGGDVPSAGADLLDALLREPGGDAIGSRRRDPRAALAEHERDADHGDPHDHGHREDLDDAQSRGSPKRRAHASIGAQTDVAEHARGRSGEPGAHCPGSRARCGLQAAACRSR